MRSNPPGVFVVGTGRCGSTAFSRILRSHRDVLSLSEWLTVMGAPRFFSEGTITAKRLWQLFEQPEPELVELLRSGWRMDELVALPAETEACKPIRLAPLPFLTDDVLGLESRLQRFVASVPPADVGVQLSTVFDWLCVDQQRQLWVERSGGSTAYLGDILRLWPDARIVHLHRDGRDVALSMSRHPFFRMLVARIEAKDPRLPVSECLAREIPLSRFGVFWSAQMVGASWLLAKHPATRVLHVGIEALSEQPDEGLRRLGGFLGVNSDDEWISRCKRELRPLLPRYTNLPEDAREGLERTCAPGLSILRKWGMHDA